MSKEMRGIVAPPVQKIVVIDGNAQVLGALEVALGSGRYDVAFVDAGHAYSTIKKARPRLVILCTRIQRLDGFRLLTMLKLDAETRRIPVLTCTTEQEGQDLDSALAQLAEDDGSISTRLAMNKN
jgi:CheY-like chemotaxis protein